MIGLVYGSIVQREGTSQVTNIAAASRGMGLLRELADRTGLSAQVTAALADTYRGPVVYAAAARLS